MKKYKTKVLENLSGALKLRRSKHLRSVVHKELQKLIKPNNYHEFLRISKAARDISNRVFVLKDTSDKRINTLVDSDFFGPAMYDATYLAGLCSLWEFEIRLLANKLGVRVTKSFEEVSSKGKKARVVEFNDLDEVLKELQKLTSFNLDLDLDLIRKVRNGLIHFNYNYARRIFNSKGGELPEEHMSSLTQVNIQTGEVEVLSQIENLGKMLEKDIYAWFIDVWGTEFPGDAQELILKNLEKIHFISNFHAYSFHEREYMREKVFVQGLKPSLEDIQLYIDYFGKLGTKIKSKEYLELIKTCFHTLK